MGGLDFSASRTSAVDAIRALIKTIVREPDGDKLRITLKGDLAAFMIAVTNSSVQSLDLAMTSA